MIAYRITAPGAPISGEGSVFEVSPPKPSPNHHTTSAQPKETSSAGLTVFRLRISPSPIAHWISPASVFHSVRSCP